MLQRKRLVLMLVYVLATIQFAWCYLWITRPYINTFEYEMGVARMPFQGRLLMMLPMQARCCTRWRRCSSCQSSGFPGQCSPRC
jgi:hypothetical protein